MDKNLFILLDFIIAFLYVFLPLILGFFHTRRVAVRNQKNDIILLYYLVISVGIQGISTGLWQVLNPLLVAEFLQWLISPFLLELGMANIAFGILGIVCPWMDRGWRTATAIGFGAFLLLTGILHVVRLMQYGYSYGDGGGFLLSDILIPFILLALVILTKEPYKTMNSR